MNVLGDQQHQVISAWRHRAICRSTLHAGIDEQISSLGAAASPAQAKAGQNSRPANLRRDALLLRRQNLNSAGGQARHAAMAYLLCDALHAMKRSLRQKGSTLLYGGIMAIFSNAARVASKTLLK